MSFFEFKTNPLYVQGPDALLELKRYSYHLGEKFLIITGCGPVSAEVTAKVRKSFDNPMASNVQQANLRYAASMAQAEQYDKENKKVVYEIHDFEGKQVTTENIEAVYQLAQKMGADVVIGVGGGKVLDLVRGVYHKMKCKVVLCPTAAATNAPASTLTVVYNDNDDIVGVLRMDYHPSLVLTDTSVMIQAPAITVAAGMGDCMGTYYDSIQGVKDMNRERQIIDMAWDAIHGSKEVFMNNGYQAMQAAKQKIVTPAYDSVIAQIVHTSGPMAVTVGVHMPHIVDELLLHFPQCKYTLHGLLVGYGVLPYMVWADRPLEEFYEYVDFCLSVGIPVSFADLGIEDEPVEKFVKAAEITAGGPTIAMTPAKLTAEDLYKSMFIANDMVKEYLAD